MKGPVCTEKRIIDEEKKINKGISVTNTILSYKEVLRLNTFKITLAEEEYI